MIIRTKIHKLSDIYCSNIGTLVEQLSDIHKNIELLDEEKHPISEIILEGDEKQYFNKVMEILIELSISATVSIRDGV